MKVLHLIPYLGRRQGGPVMALADLATAQAAAGCEVTIAAVPSPSDGPLCDFNDCIRVRLSRPSIGRMFRWCPMLARDLADSDFDVIHSHGLWTYVSVAAGRMARQRGVPHVLAPCGMLQPGARRRSHFKKLICRRLFQNRVLMEATCLHAKSATEAMELREFGLTNPMARVPNSVHPPADLAGVDPSAFRARCGLSDEHKVVLYLGRIHPVKGVERLAAAWCVGSLARNGWRLVIAGPDENRHQQAVEGLLRNAGLRETVRFVGHVHEEGKWQAFRSADLFVMPSDFENFGTAVGEALAAGLPVITTTGTPWLHLDKAGCGWCVPATTGALADALEQAIHLSEAQRIEMGEKGRQLAESFLPGGVAARMLEVYRWAVEGGAMPPHVSSLDDDT